MKVIHIIDPTYNKDCVVRLRGYWGWWSNRRPPKRRG